jgi:hypothetical protein
MSQTQQALQAGPIDFSLETYINYRLIGFSPRQAALQSGYKSEADYMKWEEDPEVQAALRNHIQSNRREILYSRDKVMEVIEKGIDICEITGDGVGMIRGAQEFNKMQGFYAPEQKEIRISADIEVRKREMSEMSEADLLEALNKDQPYIDAKFEELPDDS